MDVLLNNLVKDALNWDKRYNWEKKSAQKDTHFLLLIYFAQNITFTNNRYIQEMG
jgi:hypothetical protein